MIRTQPLKVKDLYCEFRLARSIYFHRCADTRKIIWPFTLAYYSDFIDTSVRLQLRKHSEPTWLTPAAHTYRKLKEKA